MAIQQRDTRGALKVVVLTGGSTPERNVALGGAVRVADALRTRGHDVSVVDTCLGPLSSDAESRLTEATLGVAPPPEDTLAELRDQEDWIHLVRDPLLQSADVVFPVLHGGSVEGGSLQGLLETAGIHFIGSDMRGSLLAMDKRVSKTLFRETGIPTPDWVTWPTTTDKVERLGYPLIVKPSRVGSTVGLSLVRDPDDLPEAVGHAQRFDSEILIEQFVEGRELTVGILGDEALAVGEIIPKAEIFDYECKYTPGMSEEIFPAPVDSRLTERIQSLGLQVHNALRLRHLSRVDFRVREDGTCHCLEANTLPGFTEMSLLPQSAAAHGIPYADLCERLCRLALEA